VVSFEETERVGICTKAFCNWPGEEVVVEEVGVEGAEDSEELASRVGLLFLELFNGFLVLDFVDFLLETFVFFEAVAIAAVIEVYINNIIKNQTNK